MFLIYVERDSCSAAEWEWTALVIDRGATLRPAVWLAPLDANGGLPAWEPGLGPRAVQDHRQVKVGRAKGQIQRHIGAATPDSSLSGPLGR